MKRIFLFTLILQSILYANAQKTEVKYLSGLDKDRTVEWDFYCTNGRNSGKWSKINVPSNWELQGFGTYLYGKTDTVANEKGIYKYEFIVSKNWEKKVVNIVFEGSMTDTEVKINGKLAGPIHQGAFYRFKYDISKLLKYGGSNTLEVTVNKESTNRSINRAERLADYWVFGGIFRPVYLEALPAQYIDRVAIDARADGSFRMNVITGGKGYVKSVEAFIQTNNRRIIGDTIRSDRTKDTLTIINGSFPGVIAWNPEFPTLYQVVVSIISADQIVHQVTQKFGFRTVEVKTGDGIYVNGRKIMFKGVCRHTFWPSSGRTSSKQLAIEDVRLMKDMNMNAVRMSHYPPDQYFLDVCDSLGMFVLDELAGWQKFYDTPTARRLVKQMVDRDVNHPSIVLWDNGNEGGFNKDVREDYALYDPQKRTVIEPWSIINGTNTKHYPKYDYVENALANGKEIFFPTEFLHGLYDGGHGAGLEDQWKLMMKSPLSAGAFLWVFADEGVERRDLNDSIDTKGTQAPDGILGPYHEKEGSFYAVKDIWSPVRFGEVHFGSEFDNKITIFNDYIYTNLNLCRFSVELIKYRNQFPSFEIQHLEGAVKPPDIAPGDSGSLNINMPDDWKSYDVMYIDVTDKDGRQLTRWSLNISKPQDLMPRMVVTNQEKVGFSEKDSLLTISSGKTIISFDKRTGLLKNILNDSKSVSFRNGPRFTGFKPSLVEVKHFLVDSSYVIEVLYDSSRYTRWTMLKGGWLRLDYDYNTSGSVDYAGITFSYPENLVTGAKLMANGPYHVWKNRMKGTQFGIFDKTYNNTITGQTWNYPEFKGYYSNFYAVEIATREMPITILSATNDLFLHMFTPQAPSVLGGVRGTVYPSFPDGDISILHGISAIGTKFSKAEEEGTQSRKNVYRNESLKGTLYFRFGE